MHCLHGDGGDDLPRVMFWGTLAFSLASPKPGVTQPDALWLCLAGLL